MTGDYGQVIHWRRGRDIACGASHMPAARLRDTCCCRDPEQATCEACRERFRQDVSGLAAPVTLIDAQTGTISDRHAAPPFGSAIRERFASPYIGRHRAGR